MTNERDTADSTEHNAADITDIIKEMLSQINTAPEDSVDTLKKEIMCQELHDEKSSLIF